MVRSRNGIRLCAVIGDPIGHSLSAAIFSIINERILKDKEFRYLPLQVKAGDLAASIRLLAQLLFTGINVTIPHKETILPLMDKLSPLAKLVGAVNVVKFGPRGSVGHNTDVYGIEKTLRENNIPVRGRDVVLLGAGGAAKSCAYVLAKMGASKVTIVNRNEDRSRELSKFLKKLRPQMQIVWKNKNKKNKKDNRTVMIEERDSLIINTTPMGMQGGPPWNWKLRPTDRNSFSSRWAFDLIYRPAMTPFLKEASQLGWKTLNGRDMLIWQAIKTAEIFFPEKFKGPSAEDRPSLKRRIQAANFFL